MGDEGPRELPKLSMARHHSYFLCFWPLAKCNWRPLA